MQSGFQRNIRIIIDLVLNHTSDQHRWFLESKSSKDNPKRDWYIWRDGKGDNPPNNWQSTFGGSAWEYDENTQQYYYHYFLKEQPDLNWHNPEVKQAMFDAMRFWFDRGVDGLRLDAIGTIYENPELPDHNSPYTAIDLLQYYWMGRKLTDDPKTINLFEYQRNLPEIYDLMRDLRKMTDEYEGRFLVGETDNIEFLGNGSDQLHSIFNFDLLRVKRLKPDVIRRSQNRWFSNVPDTAWQSNTLNNHDRSRVMSNFGDGKNDLALAKLPATLMLTLEGN
jgi:alpha-glucosidase